MSSFRASRTGLGRAVVRTVWEEREKHEGRKKEQRQRKRIQKKIRFCPIKFIAITINHHFWGFSKRCFVYIKYHKNTWKVDIAIILDNEFEMNLLRATQLNGEAGIRIQVNRTLETEFLTSWENCFPFLSSIGRDPKYSRCSFPTWPNNG